ncbi:MAG: hypothetical protein IJH37_01970 [Clostridia bacterium]|nr:hypothetical protein [Clostridia bacterium]
MKLNLKALYEVFGKELSHTEITVFADGEYALTNEYGEVGYINPAENTDNEDLDYREENGNFIYTNGDMEFTLTKMENDIATKDKLT